MNTVVLIMYGILPVMVCEDVATAQLQIKDMIARNVAGAERLYMLSYPVERRTYGRQLKE